jgi:hypothetical protein
MAKRSSRGGAPAGNGNGNSRPAMAIRTNDKGQIFSHIRQKWLVETPEERVRQAYVANDRMARTSKMNMILHGDGHGGVHHHNGFVNVNGIFEERFDVVLTNPPFGANVEPSDLLTDDETAVHPDAEGATVRNTETSTGTHKPASRRPRENLSRRYSSFPSGAAMAGSWAR